jgi:transposase
MILDVQLSQILAENASLKEQLSEQAKKFSQEIDYLKEQIEWFKRQIFGKRSEKIFSNEHQPLLPGFEQFLKPSEQPKLTKIPSHDRKKPNRDGKDKITLPEDLPVERQIIDLPEEEKVCQETGQPLVKIGEEVTQKLAHKPGSYFIKEIIRPKYAAPKNPDAGILTAPLPDSLLPRCFADESFLADMLVKKFADHLPLYRQSEILARQGIMISRQILSQWSVKVGYALQPIVDKMQEQILASGNIFCDEIPIDMLAPGQGKTKQGYMWAMVGGMNGNPEYRVYNFRENRKYNNAAEILKGFNGVLHSDKYGAYEILANAKQFTWCPCWGHIRRKFFEAESGDPPFRDWVLRKIRYLFMFEKVAWARSPEERLGIRQEKEAPIIDELTAAIKARLTDGKILLKSKFKEALGYYCSLIPYLKNYTLYPFARLDNNVAERAVRAFALGRKNWLFVGSEEGGESAANICSLIQTCRAFKINPREYLEDVMRRLMSHSKSKIEELLPDRWLAVKSTASQK